MYDDNSGIDRTTIILLAANALLGMVYTSSPNTYLIKSTFWLLVAVLAVIAAVLAWWLLWQEMQQRKRRANSPFFYNEDNSVMWEGLTRWVLPAFFVAMFAFIGARLVVVIWGYYGSAETVQATVVARSGEQEKPWWTLQLAAPISTTLTLAATPAQLDKYQVDDVFVLPYRDTPVSINFTGFNDYWTAQ